MADTNTKETNRKNAEEAIKFHTDDIFAALTTAKQEIEENTKQTITINKNDGTPLFAFDIRPLNESEYQSARIRATNDGVLDDARHKAELIYQATVDEDKKIWTNQQFMSAINTAYYSDVITEVLRAGDKVRIVNAIDLLSGFDRGSKTVQIANEVKNS